MGENLIDVSLGNVQANRLIDLFAFFVDGPFGASKDPGLSARDAIVARAVIVARQGTTVVRVDDVSLLTSPIP